MEEEKKNFVFGSTLVRRTRTIISFSFLAPNFFLMTHIRSASFYFSLRLDLRHSFLFHSLDTFDICIDKYDISSCLAFFFSSYASIKKKEHSNYDDMMQMVFFENEVDCFYFRNWH